MSTRKCSVEGCSEEGVRELSYSDAKVLEEELGVKLAAHHAKPPRRLGVVYLCEKHYKLWKKLSKSERKARDLALKG